MKRGFVILALTIAIMVVTAVVFQRWSLSRATPMSWLRTEFGLDDAPGRRAEALHAIHEKQCRPAK
jgi:hypothetical protein